MWYTSFFFASCFYVAFSTGATLDVPRNIQETNGRVLILGGGVAGIIAAQTLVKEGITNFLIIEGRDELGGRMQNRKFGKSNTTVEIGANWVQGTQEGDGPANPIYKLAKKHQLKYQYNDYIGSVTTFDNTGAVDYSDVFSRSVDAYVNLTVAAGARVHDSIVDSTSKTGYSIVNAKPRTIHELASEYYQFDWEYAQKPDQTSWIASSWANNFTFDPDEGGFSDANLLSIDQRGFKTIIVQEAKEFLQPDQIVLNTIVTEIRHTDSGISIITKNGTVIQGDYAICTFSLGVLQNNDVNFVPELPAWKTDAIDSMTMATYTKIFLQFPTKFWFDTEMALYADPERGRYPVWQSLDHVNFLPGSGIIFVTVTGDYSQRIEALPNAQIKTEVMSVLRSMYPNQTIPEPLDFFFPRWYSNPLFRGSYSNWPPSFISPVHDNLRANVGKLYFAGEATSQKYFGFLHGAYFEGQDMARILARCAKHGKCDGLKHFESVQNASPYEI